MKPKSFEIEAFTISYAAKKLGYKSTKTIYRLLKRDLLEDYIYLEKSGRVYLILEPPNLPTLAEKIKANIQYRRKNIINQENVSSYQNVERIIENDLENKYLDDFSQSEFQLNEEEKLFNSEILQDSKTQNNQVLI